MAVWRDVIDRYPDARMWVVQNKTVPLEVLAVLVSDADAKVRHLVVMKRKLTPELLGRLSMGDDESIRMSHSARAVADLGYEGEPEMFAIPVKKPKDGGLIVDLQACNAIHGALRCLGERANLLRTITCKGVPPLPRLSLAPRRRRRRRPGPAPP